MKKRLVAIAVGSTLFFALKGAHTEQITKVMQEEFVEKIRQVFIADPDNKVVCLYESKIFFFKNGPFDIDEIVLIPSLQKIAHCRTLGQLLDEVAERENEAFDTDNNHLMAQCILAYTSYDRSQKSLHHDPAEILRRLINNALYLTAATDMKPIDWSNGDPLKVDPDYHYRSLAIYFVQGFFGGAYDLTKIAVSSAGGETMYEYLTRELKTDIRVQRVYDLLKKFMDDDDFEGTAYHDGRGLADFCGNVSDDLFTPQVSSAYTPVEVGVVIDKSKKGSTRGSSFWTLPRILMGVGIGLIAGYLIYNNRSKKEADESDSKDILMTAGTSGTR